MRPQKLANAALAERVILGLGIAVPAVALAGIFILIVLLPFSLLTCLPHGGCVTPRLWGLIWRVAVFTAGYMAIGTAAWAVFRWRGDKGDNVGG